MRSNLISQLFFGPNLNSIEICRTNLKQIEDKWSIWDFGLVSLRRKCKMKNKWKKNLCVSPIGKEEEYVAANPFLLLISLAAFWHAQEEEEDEEERETRERKWRLWISYLSDGSLRFRLRSVFTILITTMPLFLTIVNYICVLIILVSRLFHLPFPPISHQTILSYPKCHPTPQNQVLPFLIFLNLVICFL